MYFKVILIIFFATGILQQANSQVVMQNDSLFAEEDTVKAKPRVKSKDKGPIRATLMSAVLPGLGQVYNKKYWKPPIIYGLGAALVYAVLYNRGYYKALQKAYSDTLLLIKNPKDYPGLRVKGTSYKQYEDLGFPPDRLRFARDSYKRDSEFYMILTAGLYVLNIIDATVDAHLRNFNVNENLAMELNPQINFLSGAAVNAGLNVTFTWRK